MTITIKFVGAFRHFSGADERALNCKGYISIDELVKELGKEVPELKRSLIDPHLEDPRPNALIIVNGKEIGVLAGLETKLKDGDEVVFIPVIHGG
jgi:molybdopterin synthase sulfur carrier subunit